MKTYSKSIFSIVTLLTLLTMLFSLLPTSSAQAESFARSLFTSGDFLWAGSITGGAYYEQNNSIAVDSNGNVYTTGRFYGTADFDPSPSTFSLSTSSIGDNDIFISKLDSNGNFIWAKSMGGTDIDAGNSIAVDSFGNVYTTGHFENTADFDPGVGVANLTSSSKWIDDIFVSKLDSNGNFVWAKKMGGLGNDYSHDIAVDSSGNVYTTGRFENTADFDPGQDAFNLINNSIGTDIFVSKLDTNGNFVWAKNMRGAGYEQGKSIAVDSNGNVYTTGIFIGIVDFDPGTGTFNLSSAGGDLDHYDDVFVSKLDSDGNFIWAKNMGGTEDDEVNAIAVDSNGNVYTTGRFYGPADFDPGAGVFNLTGLGSFVSKLDSGGNFVWAKGVNSGNSDNAVDSSGNVYTTGAFTGTVDFDPGVGVFNLTSADGNYDIDIFVSKLDSGGNFVWAKSMGGADDDRGLGVAVDSSGNVYTTGRFGGTVDFDPGAGTVNLTSAGGGDIFISKLEHGELVPTVASVVRASGAANPTSAASVDFTVTFSEYVTGVDVSDFSLNTTSGITGASITSVSGSGSIYTVTVITGTSANSTEQPILRVDVVDDDTILDSINNNLGGQGLGNGNFTNGQSYIKISIFTDVPFSYWANSYVERLSKAGITGGCSTGMYCPDNTVTRAQMAVFLLKGIHGSSYTPPAVGGNTGFGDVATDYWAAAWIKQLAAEGITGGCGGGNYCPDNTVTRAQMAVFLMKAKNGSSYSPPGVGGSTGFSDVATNYWAAAFIKQLVADSITAGCGNGNYCPEDSVTRAQMAVFLVKAFNLP